MPVYWVSGRGLIGRRQLGRELVTGLDHFFQHLQEFFQTGAGDDDAVAPSPPIFGDAQDPATGIVPEAEQK